MGTEAQSRTSTLEWLAAAIGLILLLGVLVVIGREAWWGETAQPPSIVVAMTKAAPLEDGYLVEFEARNRSSGTAAAVTVEGKLGEGEEAETTTATLDYVAGYGRATGGLFFKNDPRHGRLALRALGYQLP